MKNAPTDPVPLAQALIRCPSVTPADAGALGVMEQALTALGFTCHRLTFGETPNIFARRGTEGPHTVYGGSEREPNGSGDLLLAKDDGPRWIRRAYELNGDDGSELGYQGLSMVVTTAAARR